jgi:transcriptional regulator with XRE-family HTH domain
MESNDSNDSEQSVDQQLALFGQKIREFRTTRGLTQLELAENSALDRKTISRIENHQYSPSLSSIFAIASALNVDPKELMP